MQTSFLDCETVDSVADNHAVSLGFMAACLDT